MAKDSEKRYLSEIHSYLDDAEFKEKFLKSKGLCIPHFNQFLKKYKTAPEWFINFNISNYKSILQQTYNFIDSLNFNENKESIPLNSEEKIVWKRIVQIISGYEGLHLYDYLTVTNNLFNCFTRLFNKKRTSI